MRIAIVIIVMSVITCWLLGSFEALPASAFEHGQQDKQPSCRSLIVVMCDDGHDDNEEEEEEEEEDGGYDDELITVLIGMMFLIMLLLVFILKKSSPQFIDPPEKKLSQKNPPLGNLTRLHIFASYCIHIKTL